MTTDQVSLSEKDFRALRLFRDIANSGGLTAAEKTTGLERSTLSRQIKALEESLGAPICRRGPGGFDLTDFGKEVLVAAVTLGDALEEINQGLTSAKATIRGELRLGIADNCITNPESKLVDALARFTQTAPEVDFSLTIGQPSELLRALHEFKVNCCVLGAIPDDRSLAIDHLFSEEFRLYIHGDLDPVPDMRTLAKRGIELIVQNEPAAMPAFLRTVKRGQAVLAEGLEAIALLIATRRFAGQLPTHYAAALATVIPLREVPGARLAATTVPFSFVRIASRASTRAQQHLRTILLQTHAKIPPRGSFSNVQTSASVILAVSS